FASSSQSCHCLCGLCGLCAAHFVGPFLEGMAGLAPSRRYLGDVGVWWKDDTRLLRWPRASSKCSTTYHRALMNGPSIQGTAPNNGSQSSQPSAKSKNEAGKLRRAKHEPA